MVRQTPPWATGPGEILKHGLKLLESDSDTNRRLAMIMIDNSVELMIKTFLGLPKRINGLSISRKDYQEFSNNFNDLLDALEKYAADKLKGIDLGEIEWYHRLRNELYHQGNGLTVERDKVEIYAELANLVFRNLFGFNLLETQNKSAELLGQFMEYWVTIEKGLFSIVDRNSLLGYNRKSIIDALKRAKEAGIVPEDILSYIQEFRILRNNIIHGEKDYKDVLTSEIIEKTKEIADIFRDIS